MQSMPELWLGSVWMREGIKVMNLKLRLKFGDILKLLFGQDLIVLDPYNNTIYRVQKGDGTYVYKG